MQIIGSVTRKCPVCKKITELHRWNAGEDLDHFRQCHNCSSIINMNELDKGNRRRILKLKKLRKSLDEN